MKNKIFVLLAVVLVLFGLSSFVVVAETPDGFYDIGSYQDIEIKPFSDQTEVEATEINLDSDDELEQWYKDSNRLEVTYKAATLGGYYGVVLVEGSGLPSRDNDIIYIDQLAAESSTINFNVYPMLPNKTTPLSLYISSNMSSFELIKIPVNYYLEGSESSYTLGDIDNSGKCEVDDALLALQIVAELHTPTTTETLAADVDCNGRVEIDDALMILQYVAEIIDSWN